MTRSNADHRIADIIKNLEQRVANLEEKDRSVSTPNLLRTVYDTVIVDDSQLSATSYDMEPAQWGDVDSRGDYTVGTWGSRL